MLVLSRRLDEKILLPSVPAVIKVITAQAGLVRLGVEAPSHVPIVREELTRNAKHFGLLPEPALLDGPAPNLRHVVRNRLNNLTLGLTLLRMQLADCDASVRKTLDGLEDELQALRRQVVASAAAEAVPELVPTPA